MRIGIDFDNTIVSYDELFHQIALEKKLIPKNFPINKIAIRDYLRSENNENIWTMMQGEIYGLRMNEAKPYENVIDFIIEAKHAGYDLHIVSHKTKKPFLGPQYNLHHIASKWINSNLIFDNNPLFDKNHIHYEITKEDKVNCIKIIECDVFIDDLPEIFLMQSFPNNIKKILFDPDSKNNKYKNKLHITNSWNDIINHLLRK